MTTLLRVLTANPAATETACQKLAEIGEQASGAHDCGIFVRTEHPALTAKTLGLLPPAVVYSVWDGHNKLIGVSR